MKKQTQSTSFVKKIVIDEVSNEPKIIEVSESEYLSSTPIEKKDFVQMKSHKSIGKQMAMERVLGITKEQAVDKKQMLFKKLTTTLFIIFILGVLCYTAYQDFFTTGPNKQFPSLKALKEIFVNGWFYFAFAVLSLLFGFFVKGLKNVVMCKTLTKKWHFTTCMETAIIGTYYNNVTPLAVGGQPFEIYHLSKHGVRGGVASSIPIASFFLNQIAFVILAGLSIVLFKADALSAPTILLQAFPQTFYVLAVVGCVCCIFVPTLVVLFSIFPKIGAKLVYFVIKLGTKLKLIKHPNQTLTSTIKTVVHNSHCLKKIASKPLMFSLLFVLSFIENLFNVSIAFFVLKAFGMSIESLSIFSEWAIVSTITFILYSSITFIPTPGNSGAADLSFFLMFECLLLPGLAFPAMITWRLCSFYLTLVIGFTFASLKKKSDLKKVGTRKEFSVDEAEEVSLPKNLVIPVIEEVNETSNTFDNMD